MFRFVKFVFPIFYSIKFENSPLFPAFTVVKSVQKQFSNNHEINFKQLLINHAKLQKKGKLFNAKAKKCQNILCRFCRL